MIDWLNPCLIQQAKRKAGELLGLHMLGLKPRHPVMLMFSTHRRSLMSADLQAYMLLFLTDPDRQSIYSHAVDVEIQHAWFERSAPCVYKGVLEEQMRLHIIDPLTADEIQTVWNALAKRFPQLGVNCAWCEWGEYKGCVLEMPYVSEEVKGKCQCSGQTVVHDSILRGGSRVR